MSGRPPAVAISVVIEGQPVFARTWSEREWLAAVSAGDLPWDLAAYGGGQFAVGVVPVAAESVELRTSGGDTFLLCPVAVPGIEPVKVVAGHVPVEEGTLEVVALDRGGHRVARGAVALPLFHGAEDDQPGGATEADDEAHVPFLLRVDRTRVRLPLGGEG